MELIIAPVEDYSKDLVDAQLYKFIDPSCIIIALFPPKTANVNVWVNL